MPKTTANRFERTRRDHTLETAEDYVELIQTLIDESGEARAVDVATRLGISPVTVTQTVQRLTREGYVDTAPYKSLKLTEKGSALAARAKERHEIVLGFLLALGVSKEAAEHDAEGMEHHACDETLEAMRRFQREKS